jgi:hypothetical protein
MKTHFVFKSNKFPSYGNESEGVNWDAGIYGRRLAEYLTENLAATGIVVDALAEDWGWDLSVVHEGKFRMFIGCGCNNHPESDGSFHVFVEPKKPTIRRWFKTIDVREPVERIVNAVYSILSSDPDIYDLKWEEP